MKAFSVSHPKPLLFSESREGLGGLSPVRLIGGDIKCNLCTSRCTGSEGKSPGAAGRAAGLQSGPSGGSCHEQQKQRLWGVGQCQTFSPESWRRSRSHELTSGDSGSVAAMNQGKALPQSRPSGLGPTVCNSRWASPTALRSQRAGPSHWISFCYRTRGAVRTGLSVLKTDSG